MGEVTAVDSGQWSVISERQRTEVTAVDSGQRTAGGAFASTPFTNHASRNTHLRLQNPLVVLDFQLPDRDAAVAVPFGAVGPDARERAKGAGRAQVLPDLRVHLLDLQRFVLAG